MCMCRDPNRWFGRDFRPSLHERFLLVFVELFLKEYFANIVFNAQESGVNPLMLASRDNRIVVVERLLEMGVNVNDRAQVNAEVCYRICYWVLFFEISGSVFLTFYEQNCCDCSCLSCQGGAFVENLNWMYCKSAQQRSYSAANQSNGSDSPYRAYAVFCDLQVWFCVQRQHF